tara:strand:- start:220 stop:408 length:189 start_codon:yes stop_codon:yes gene_type:complete
MASAQDEWEEEYDDVEINSDEDIWADYDTEGERNSWFYGNPGDENYVDPATITEEDLVTLEE